MASDWPSKRLRQRRSRSTEPSGIEAEPRQKRMEDRPGEEEGRKRKLKKQAADKQNNNNQKTDSDMKGSSGDHCLDSSSGEG